MSDGSQRPPIRVALAGLGRAMFEDHYPIFKAHPSLFKVVCACDLIKERRDIVERDFPECKMFRKIPEMLEEHDIDLVDIATITTSHVEDAQLSLKKGFWTLVETPIALTPDAALLLRGSVHKARNRLLVMQRGIFAPDFLLAKNMMTDKRLGKIYHISIKSQDFIRRDDWQSTRRLGGGAAYYAMPDMLMQALRLLPSHPTQMWSELKRVASLGDAEDYVHINLRTHGMITAEVEYNGGALKEDRGPSFTIRGENGIFKVNPGAHEGKLTIIDPEFKFPRRRSAVSTPEIVDLHEEFPTVNIPVALEHGTPTGISVFWRSVYNTIRVAAPFPATFEEALDTVKFAYLAKKTSPFAM